MHAHYPIRSLIKIGRKLYDFLEEDGKSGEFSIFLCGGAGKAESWLRRQVAVEVPLRGKYTYRTYFPEHLFLDVLYAHHRTDLLGLEAQLANSVHVVAIMLHSAGTIAELGAFANHPTLRHKLIVFTDPRHRRANSFINLGPLRLLERQNRDAVHRIPLARTSASEIADRIRSFARDVGANPELEPSGNLDNPLRAYEFVLALLYVLPPITIEHLRTVMTEVSCLDKSEMSIVADAVAGALIRDGYVKRSPTGLHTTTRAKLRLFPRTKLTIFNARRRVLHDLRTIAINDLYRGRNRIQRGESAAWTAL